MDKIKADPLALNAIIHAVLKGPKTTPDDFKRATLVDGFSMIYHTFPDWAEPAPGDFSILGLLENMHTLHFPNAPSRDPIQVDDFSFLSQCRKLKRLDVSCTTFSDCSILPQLPPLSYVRLPPKEQLTHLDALEQLPKLTKVSFLDRTPWTLPSVQPVPPPPRKEPEGSDKAKAIVEELKKRTATDCYTLNIQPDVAPGLLDSKFGGFPYWDPAMPYPADERGKKLVLLAQINFDQFQADEPLPQTGLLQFFIGQDDVCGADFEEPDRQDGFRVVYHEAPNPSITEEQLRPLDIPTHDHEGLEFFPVFRQAAVTVEKAVGYIGLDDRSMETVFSQAVKAAVGEDTKGITPYKYFEKEDYDYFHEQFYSCGHRMLGYPYFTQYDPRPDDSPYDTLLFQIDSDGIGKEDYVLWGDCGVANFFINLEDLKKRDFSKVFYTWDCC